MLRALTGLHRLLLLCSGCRRPRLTRRAVPLPLRAGDVALRRSVWSYMAVMRSSEHLKSATPWYDAQNSLKITYHTGCFYVLSCTINTQNFSYLREALTRRAGTS